MSIGRFSRTELLLGAEAMEKLKRARVAVFGIGGVGGYAVEALARCGIGALDLIDKDIRVTAFEGPYFERVRVDPQDAALYVPCGLGHRERAFPRANDKDVKPLPSPDFVPNMWRPTTWYALKDGRYTYDTCFHPGVGLTMSWLALTSEACRPLSVRSSSKRF